MAREKLSKLFDPTGRLAIVTGGTRGIGLAIAEGFVAAGAKVVVASRKPEAWEESYAVNLRGPVFLVQEALPHLKASPGAAVINVISAGAFLFSTVASMYAGAKAALMSFTRSMAAEFAPLGIRVNALAPGTVDTAMLRKNTPEAQRIMSEASFQRRAARPDEMVGPPAAARLRCGKLHHRPGHHCGWRTHAALRTVNGRESKVARITEWDRSRV